MNVHDNSHVYLSESQARELEDVYNGLLDKFRGVSGNTDAEFTYKTILELIDSIIERLTSTGRSLLLFCSKVYGEDYIFAHSFNVCLIAVRIGIKLNLDKARLEKLGFLTLTHAGKDLGFPEDVFRQIEPDTELDEIMRLADVYDALTQPPPHRHTTTPYETITSVIDSPGIFPANLTKILLEEIGLYPEGSWVQLSNREIGKVIQASKQMPLRPVVEVFIGSAGIKKVDLSKNMLNHILRPLTAEEAKQKLSGTKD
ncbi:hypothetical protein ACFL5Y_01690 [Candidatus Omnitrophota bacterium]